MAGTDEIPNSFPPGLRLGKQACLLCRISPNVKAEKKTSRDVC